MLLITLLGTSVYSVGATGDYVLSTKAGNVGIGITCGAQVVEVTGGTSWGDWQGQTSSNQNYNL